MINTELLQEKLNKSGFKMTFVATELGITYQALLNKLNNKLEFSAGEIISLGRLLHLTGAEVGSIFFQQQRKEQDNENNSGNYREVPHGTYEVAVNKMELTKSKKGKPMVSIWFKIAAGDFAGSLIFYNQVIDNSFGIHNNNELLRSMDLDCINNLGEHDHDVFQSFGQYGNLLMDAKEEIDEAGLTFQLAYTPQTQRMANYKASAILKPSTYRNK